MTLTKTANLSAPDDFYEALLSGHEGLDGAQSEALNARLILLLANQIGDCAIVREAISAARQSVLEDARLVGVPHKARDRT